MEAWAASTANQSGLDAAGGLPFIVQAVVLMGAALVFAPLFKKLGLGTVLGYLAAGVAIGPILGVVPGGEDLLHFAELGIVFLLFVIGLELNPRRLWALRNEIFGIGSLQVLLSAWAIGLACFFLEYSWQTSMMVGLGLALSSTAFGVQILNDKRELNTNYGQKSFAIVLFQDIALVPILAIIPFLVPQFLQDALDAPQASYDWLTLVKSGGVIVGLIVVGHFLLNHVFRIVANTGAREMMFAVALFVVLGAGYVTQEVGLSMGLGAFIAGVMLADSAYRHELEANIDPFRGLLLGLFFMAVGLSLDIDVITANWQVILLAAPALMLMKAFILYGIIRFFTGNHNDSIRIAALLPQAGEFGFVIFSAASLAGIVSNQLSSIITAVVTVTMALTPFSVMLGSRLMTKAAEEEMEEDFEDAGGQVFMIGFGRFGQIVAQALLAEGIKVTVIDHNPEQIRSAAKFGFRIFYGEGKRLEVLQKAHVEKADLVIVCSGGRDRTTEIVGLLKEHYAEAKVYARAYDRNHAVELQELGVDFQVREMFESSIVLGEAVLEAMDVPAERARFIVDDVRQRDIDLLQLQLTKGVLTAADLKYQDSLAPQPLVEPQTEATSLTDETEKITRETE